MNRPEMLPLHNTSTSRHITAINQDEIDLFFAVFSPVFNTYILYNK
jgi:hypothetical protein